MSDPDFPAYIHVQSMRLANGEEALIAVVVTSAGTVGYGFDLKLDATAARHMAMRAAGLAPAYAGATASESSPPPPPGSSAPPR